MSGDPSSACDCSGPMPLSPRRQITFCSAQQVASASLCPTNRLLFGGHVFWIGGQGFSSAKLEGTQPSPWGGGVQPPSTLFPGRVFFFLVLPPPSLKKKPCFQPSSSTCHLPARLQTPRWGGSAEIKLGPARQSRAGPNKIWKR